MRKSTRRLLRTIWNMLLGSLITVGMLWLYTLYLRVIVMEKFMAGFLQMLSQLMSQ